MPRSLTPPSRDEHDPSRDRPHLLGAKVTIGAAGIARVTGILVDADSSPVLLRVEGDALQAVSYVPHAALERSAPGSLCVTGPHLLLGRAEASFYESQGLVWVTCGDDVWASPGVGKVEC